MFNIDIFLDQSQANVDESSLEYQNNNHKENGSMQMGQGYTGIDPWKEIVCHNAGFL